jgi:hypothetical protein
MNAQSILPGMAVFGSCGNRLGTVDHFEDGAIKLRRTGPDADGHHHFIPVDCRGNAATRAPAADFRKGSAPGGAG